MDRIESPPSALLGPLTPEREAQLENLTRANGRRGPDNVLWRNKVQGTALVSCAPAAPVRELLPEFLEIAHDTRLSSIHLNEGQNSSRLSGMAFHDYLQLTYM
jgi:hypothetical protein